MDIQASDKRDQLHREGYCIFPGVLDAATLQDLRAATARLIAPRTAADRARHRSTGSMFGFSGVEDEIWGELVLYPGLFDCLRQLGYTEVTFTDGYVISKPPQSPQLFWHYDWFTWVEPEDFQPAPQQVFAMYYLTDTSRYNGCLRVIPGSHYRHNPLHEVIGQPHSEELHRMEDANRPEFRPRADEIDVPVRAGDLVLGDARLLHAAHGNQSDEERTVITLWYQPDFPSLPEATRRQMVEKSQTLPASWNSELRRAVQAVMAHYEGSVPAHPRMYRPQDPKEGQTA